MSRTGAFTSKVRLAVNRLLALVGLELRTLTAERKEARRLEGLRNDGHFARQAFPVPEAFRQADPGPVVLAVAEFENEFARFEKEEAAVGGFSFQNEYFGSPDAEVLYALVRKTMPGQIVEVGSGNSTHIMRRAIVDGGLTTRIVAIDPCPRRDVEAKADQVLLLPVEAVNRSVFEGLRENDILFVDSSHTIASGGDVVTVLLQVVAGLPKGVLLHIHDVFLPWDYPESWVVKHRWPFTEQYVVQAMLNFGDAFEVLWPGHFYQRTRREFREWFPRSRERAAQSLWLRTRGSACERVSDLQTRRPKALQPLGE